MLSQLEYKNAIKIINNLYGEKPEALQNGGGRVEGVQECQDTDDIPKVDGAGKMVTKDGINFQLMHNGIKILPNCYHGGYMMKIIEYYDFCKSLFFFYCITMRSARSNLSDSLSYFPRISRLSTSRVILFWKQR